MKKLIYLLFVLFIVLSACKKEKSDYVNDFSPKLLDTKGTIYSGNYFPIVVGYSWNWAGQRVTDGTLKYSIGSKYSTINIDTTEDIYSYMDISDSVKIDLPSGTYNVLETDENNDTHRYFQITDNAVTIKAIKLGESERYVEIKNPVFLKIPLVAGDSWETQPSLDLNQLTNLVGSQGSDIKLNSNCKIFVLGKESIIWKKSSKSTIALEERAAINGSMNMDDQGNTGNMNFNLTADIKLNLLENFGIVRQKSNIKGTVNMSVSYVGYTITRNFNITNVDDSLKLSSYYFPDTDKNYSILKPKSNILLKNSLIDSLDGTTFNKQIRLSLSLIDKLKKAGIF